MQHEPQVTVLAAGECWKRLRSTPFGRLAVTVPGEGPDIFPVNFRVHDDTIVFRTAQGTKLAATSQGARVAFEAEHVDTGTGQAWSVVAKGTAREATDDLLLAQTTGALLFSWEPGAKDHLVRIAVDTLTGRQFHIHIPQDGNLSLDDALRAGLE